MANERGALMTRSAWLTKGFRPRGLDGLTVCA